MSKVAVRVSVKHKDGSISVRMIPYDGDMLAEKGISMDDRMKHIKRELITEGKEVLSISWKTVSDNEYWDLISRY